MGVVLGTLQWEGHEEMIDKLEELRKEHRLEMAEPHYLSSKHRFGVSISGFSILWTSEHTARVIVNSFLEDAKEMLLKQKISCETNVTFLPP